MSKEITMQFVGFASKALVREYTFTVREPSIEPREFRLTIANEAFSEHGVRFQDAPDICSRKLRRELDANANHPLESHFHITDADLDDYRSTHSPKPRSFFSRKNTENY